ncbi:Excinuclease ABC subunit C [Ignavibacterium album JCM 16511]|uniref:UvrABC system protein C n=1 Tax=Ignavibacterium album (strain DSM 19864 / JCM 16511 / NBRC 101810 / Mat9-16) TaxID=945713 RepID=I0AIR5_IGNAJ|nr:excinuclease ABC subunit UvrC [Ignavibacterium album]AFH48872.1 Excinuclease ABC subunit C [Ignavibacterium album JCM 16511]
MNSKLELQLKNLPSQPGVYQFLNKNGKIIYVGKAKNLRNRVRSYFQNNVTSPKTLAIVEKTEELQIVVTDSEVEALILENNLIKQFKPRYNVNLKDDKSYPFIKVTNELFPRIYPTRHLLNDGSKYFGPYTDVKSMKASLRMINQIFRIRSCKLDLTEENINAKKFKVCLDYHIKKCDGPCEGLISAVAYNEMVKEVIQLLKGRTDELIKSLTEKMNNAVENLEFEKAAELRDKINQLTSISSKQKIVSDDFDDRDIFAIAFEGKDSSCSVFNIRDGKLIGKKQLRLSIEEGEELPHIYSAAIKFYYQDFAEIPKEIVLEIEPEDKDAILEWLIQKVNNKVKFVIPQRGDLKSLVKMCKENAMLQLKEIQIQKMKNLGNVPYPLAALQRDLRLKNLPKKIECFDISNIQGSDSVASMVVFVDGKPKKSLYRKFIIKSIEGPDDFASMREVIERRYSKLLTENETFPDLIMVDGGKGQLSSAVEILNKLGFRNYNIIGLAKRLEEVFFPGKSEPETIAKTSSGLKLLQQIRDEAHRFAITFHRQRRSKRIISTELTEIKGIGTQTAKLLIEKFGSLEAVKSSSLEELASVIGIKKAELVKSHFNQSTE